MVYEYEQSVIDRVIAQIVACQSLRELDRVLHSPSIGNMGSSDSRLPRGLRFKTRCILNLAIFVDAIRQQGNMDYLRGLIANQLSQFNEVDEMQCLRAILRLVDNINSFRDENLILLEFRRIGGLLRRE